MYLCPFCDHHTVPNPCLPSHCYVVSVRKLSMLVSVCEYGLQSSSPSYLLMASLDGATAHAQQQGIWEEPLRAGRALSVALQELPGLEVLSQSHAGEACHQDAVKNSRECWSCCYCCCYCRFLNCCCFDCHSTKCNAARFCLHFDRIFMLPLLLS